MTDLHPLQQVLPSELVHEVRQFVGPHPCAVLIKDHCGDIEYTGREGVALIEYMSWYAEWEEKLRRCCLHETMLRLLADRTEGAYIITRDPPALWPPPRTIATPAGHAERSST